MEELSQLLQQPSRKLMIIGIGNQLRSDDGVGPKILDRLEPSPGIELLNAETNIERYIEPIQQSGADLLLFIDCLSFGREPGHSALLPISEIEDFSFHSHNISLKRIREFFSVPAFVIGIEPQTLKVGEVLSPPVQKTADQIVTLIKQELKART